jgi:tetratricopeptide (TPR) repeat protein
VNFTRISFSLSLIGAGIAVLLCFIPPASGDTISAVVQGTVVMRDGSPPPFQVGIQRLCYDNIGYDGSAPGPLTNKNGEYVWRMDFDTKFTRTCHLEATKAGYTSSQVDISSIDPALNHSVKLEPLVLTSNLSDPYLIREKDDAIPSKALNPWKAAMKAVDANDYPEALKQLQAVVTTAPKSAIGWHTLGIVYDKQRMFPAARDAYQQAIEADPKMLPPYVTLTRVLIKSKEWDGALKAADELIKVDKKNVYPESHLHRAVAQYGLKDLAGAEMTVQEVIRQDPKHSQPRAEFVLGRILEAKGDLNGAREHMTKYLELDPKVGDADSIKSHLLTMGQANMAHVEPNLEPF